MTIVGIVDAPNSSPVFPPATPLFPALDLNALPKCSTEQAGGGPGKEIIRVEFDAGGRSASRRNEEQYLNARSHRAEAS